MESKTAEPVNVEKVRDWVAGLTREQEIHCDLYAGPNGLDPHHASWALVELEPESGRVLDLIDQSSEAPNDHIAISDYLDSEEQAGRIVGIACGYYHHPERAAADRAASEQRKQYLEARDKALLAIVPMLEGIATQLHVLTPKSSRDAILQDLVRALDLEIGAEATVFDESEDVAF